MSPSPDRSWFLNELVRAPHVRHAVLLSADGLPVAWSEGVDRDLADTVSALASGMQSLSRAGAKFVSDSETAWEQTMVSYDEGYMFILAAGGGSFLGVAAGKFVEIESLSYEMTKLIDRLGSGMGVEMRPTPADSA